MERCQSDNKNERHGYKTVIKIIIIEKNKMNNYQIAKELRDVGASDSDVLVDKALKIWEAWDINKTIKVVNELDLFMAATEKCKQSLPKKFIADGYFEENVLYLTFCLKNEKGEGIAKNKEETTNAMQNVALLKAIIPDIKKFKISATAFKDHQIAGSLSFNGSAADILFEIAVSGFDLSKKLINTLDNNKLNWPENIKNYEKVLINKNIGLSAQNNINKI